MQVLQSVKRPKTSLNSIIGPTQQRTLTLKQLREMIIDIYNQKTRFDVKCDEAKVPKETME